MRSDSQVSQGFRVYLIRLARFLLTDDDEDDMVAGVARQNTCKRCGHVWESKPNLIGRPKSCPRCKSYKWNKEIKNGANKVR
jgi:predicted Zn-ribbon and HTH transcriptional regulator